MQFANSGLSWRALSMAGPRCSYTTARSHSRRLPISLPWISVAIAWGLIHDFLFARYAMDGVDLSPLNPTPRSQ
jgi:hypothetical protein